VVAPYWKIIAFLNYPFCYDDGHQGNQEAVNMGT